MPYFQGKHGRSIMAFTFEVRLEERLDLQEAQVFTFPSA